MLKSYPQMSKMRIVDAKGIQEVNQFILMQ